jgi:hypothetical protein
VHSEARRAWGPGGKGREEERWLSGGEGRVVAGGAGWWMADGGMVVAVVGYDGV